MRINLIPKKEGFVFPAEWEKHRATWVSLPLNDESWPGRMKAVYHTFFQFIRVISLSESVAINVHDDRMSSFVMENAEKYHIDASRLELYLHPTNDCWTRDHGPAFLKGRDGKKLIVNWEFNAWGEKYAFELDNLIPAKIGDALKLPVLNTNIVMEGGALEFNGAGTVMTTRSCLLNDNRNPGLQASGIETYLMNYYGVEQVLWLENGIIGDDTDGHIDNLARFVSRDTVLMALEQNRWDPNYITLKTNRNLVSGYRLPDGKQLNIIDLPMPPPVYLNQHRLPASYVNFYITNAHVVVPVFQVKTDEEALEIIQYCFPDRKIIGIDANVLIHGLGGFHCLCQQEPV